MERRHIAAPLMVVRGDGTLMSDEFAARTPVETIHSGPAASAIGGRFLSGLDDALVVDVGGTTTDLALVLSGQVTVTTEGAMVGRVQDRRAGRQPALDCSRAATATSLTRATARSWSAPSVCCHWRTWRADFPDVGKRLKALARRQWAQATPDWLEYWYLLREPPPGLVQTPREESLVSLLREGPQPVPEILKHLKVLHIGQVEARELLRQEIIGKAGLTPTDLMHIEGTYSSWDGEAAAAALGRLCAQPLARARPRCGGHLAPHHGDGAARHRDVPLRQAPAGARRGGRASALPRSGRGSSTTPCTTHTHSSTSSFTCARPSLASARPAGLFLKPVAEALHTELILARALRGGQRRRRHRRDRHGHRGDPGVPAA